MVAQVLGQSRAAARVLGGDHLHAECREDPPGRSVNARQERGLHTALQEEHALTRQGARRDGREADPWRRTRAGLNLGFEGLGQDGSEPLAESISRRKQHRGQEVDQERPERASGPWTCDLGVDQGATHIEQMAILHTTGAGALAAATRETPIQVLLRAPGGRLALEDLTDQIDAPAWAIELVAQELVGGASGGAKATMHTLAQHVLAGLGEQGVFVLGGEGGLHGADL